MPVMGNDLPLQFAHRPFDVMLWWGPNETAQVGQYCRPRALERPFQQSEHQCCSGARSFEQPKHRGGKTRAVRFCAAS
jgi:hypothetical protein